MRVKAPPPDQPALEQVMHVKAPPPDQYDQVYERYTVDSSRRD